MGKNQDNTDNTDTPTHLGNFLRYQKDTMTPFDLFLHGLRADARLGRYLPPATQYQTPETVILALTLALAEATEGTRPHPAHMLLEELDAAVCAR